jgi:hypothetical protein
MIVATFFRKGSGNYKTLRPRFLFPVAGAERVAEYGE